MTFVPDSPEARKSRGAFFTPDPITQYVCNWAIRDASDLVFEPAAGDAAFLVAAVARLRELGATTARAPRVFGVELHAPSAHEGAARVAASGGEAAIHVGDFFQHPATPTFDAVVGNPPYVRYQEWTGPQRARAQEAALRAGVALSGLASSWAPFTVQACQYLRLGGRLGLVLPAELLSTNYAGPVRQYLLCSFASVRLVLFNRQVFPDAEADVLLLLAEGFGLGPNDHATVHQAADAAGLIDLPLSGLAWKPPTPAGKWTGSLVNREAQTALQQAASSSFVSLETWGATTLGMVTGNNKYFAMSPARARELSLPEQELLHISPPGSGHLRGLDLSPSRLSALGRQGAATRLFRPAGEPSSAAAAYIQAGESTAVDSAYKCRTRKPWWRVPLLAPADLLLTCMNADTPRVVGNSARAHHLNSIHGIYLRRQHAEVGQRYLPLASLNSLTVLHAEIVGRSYGGGILKIEPREADEWLIPSPDLLAQKGPALDAIRGRVARQLAAGKLLAAIDTVDTVLLQGVPPVNHLLEHVRAARELLAGRRAQRGTRG